MFDNYLASSPLPKVGPYLPTLIVTVAACYVLQNATHALGPRIIPEKWAKYDRRTRRSFATRVVSTLHAFISGGAALYHLRNETLKSNPVFGFDSSVGQLCAFSMGYFIWDTIDSIRNSTIGFVAHGIASVALFLFTFRPFMAGYVPTFLLWELSTPFLNFHWFMEKLGVKNTHPTLFTINAAIFALIFFLARICHGNYSGIAFFRHLLWAEKQRIPLYLQIIYGSAGIVLTCLNAFWFSKIVAQFRARNEGQKVSKPRVE